MQEQFPSGLSLYVKSSALHGRLSAIFGLVVRWFCVRCHKLLPWRKGYAQSNYIPGELTPFSLLQECRSDLRTALFRMGQRVDKLPFPYMALFGSSEVDATGHLAPDTRTLGCMMDMQRFESRFPTATDFDWELFQTGWAAGAEWADGNTYKKARGENTCHSLAAPL